MAQIMLRIQTLEEEKANIPTFPDLANPFHVQIGELKSAAIIERPQPEATKVVLHASIPSGAAVIVELSAQTVIDLHKALLDAEQRFINLKGNRN